MNNFGAVVGCQMLFNKNSGPEAKPVEHHKIQDQHSYSMLLFTI